MTPEGCTKRDVKKVLQKHGVWFYMPVQNGMGVTGIPDFVCCHNGRFIGIETKAPGKEPTPNQARIGQGIMAHGGIWIVVHDAQDLDNYFNTAGDELRRAVWDAIHPMPPLSELLRFGAGR